VPVLPRNMVQDPCQEPAPWQARSPCTAWAGDSRAWQPWQALPNGAAGPGAAGKRGLAPDATGSLKWLPGRKELVGRAVNVHAQLPLLSGAVLQQPMPVVRWPASGALCGRVPSGGRWRTALQAMAARLGAG